MFRSAAFAQQTGDSCVNTADCTLPPIHLAADSALVQAEEIQQEISALDLADLPRKEHPDFWLNRIKAGSYDIKDSTIIYPKFPALCVKIYNWADRTLNTYDHDYVMPTGKKWKVMWKGSFWSDSYALDIPDNVHIRMLSSLYMSSGPYVSFMALTVGYAANLNRLISHVPARQKRFDFSFSTALFEVDLYYTRNRDGTVIRRFEPYDQGKLLHVEFPSLQLENWGVAAFYFLNNRRYYQGAAFNYSKFRSALRARLSSVWPTLTIKLTSTWAPCHRR